MGSRSILHALIAACALGAPLSAGSAAHALQLITKEEAALPSVHSGHERGISRGPTVVIVSPSPAAGTVGSPFELKIRFVAHGGAEIDPESVLVTYLKDPAVDLTQRLRPFITTVGIDVKDAEVPAGTHWLRVDVTDSTGHAGWADFSFRVSQ
jgi:hypothetical protein